MIKLVCYTINISTSEAKFLCLPDSSAMDGDNLNNTLCRTTRHSKDKGSVQLFFKAPCFQTAEVSCE